MDQTSVTPMDRERLPLLLAYGLYLVGIVNGITMLIGFVVALVRRDAARGTVYESHYRNLITVFIVMMVFTGLMLTLAAAGLTRVFFALFSDHPLWDLASWFPFPALLVPVALVGWVVLGIWYLWRVIGGFLRALEERPY